MPHFDVAILLYMCSLFDAYDDEISRFILPKPHETIKETIEFYEKIEKDYLEHKSIYYGIFYQEEKLIGFIVLVSIKKLTVMINKKFTTPRQLVF